MSINHRGNRLYRFKQNPLEKVFSDLWYKENERPNEAPGVLAWSMGDGQFAAAVSQRDATVAAAVIQWLGSPVGQRFIADALIHKDAEEFREMVKEELAAYKRDKE